MKNILSKKFLLTVFLTLFILTSAAALGFLNKNDNPDNSGNITNSANTANNESDNNNTQTDRINIQANPNWSPPNAITLTPNTWGEGFFPRTGNRELWFKFTAASDNQYIHFENGDDDFEWDFLDLQLYNDSGNPIGDEFELYNTSRSHKLNVSRGRVYYIKVWPHYSSGVGNFFIAINSSSISPDEYAPDDPSWPPAFTTLTDNNFGDGNIAAGGQQWYRFTATAATQYIHFRPGTLKAAFVQVYTAAGSIVNDPEEYLYPVRSYLYDSDYYLITSRNLTAGQTYYIRVYPERANLAGNFQVMFNTVYTPYSDFVWPPKAVTLTAGAWVKDELPRGGEQWYIFRATSNTQYIHFDPGTLAYLRTQLYDSNGEKIAGYTWLEPTNLFMSRSVTSGQAYYLWVEPIGSETSGTYELIISNSQVKPAKR